MSSSFIIYGLIDPRTLLVRYVGKSESGMSRPRSHRGLARTGRHCASWIRALIAAGFSYDIAVLEELPSRDVLEESERWWIAFGRASGWPLTNLTDGGGGCAGYKHSEQTKKRIGEASRRHLAAKRPEVRAKMRERYTPEVRAAYADRMRGDKNPAKRSEARAKMSLAQRRRWSDDARKNHHNTRPEHKARLRAAILGDLNPAKSPAVRAKIKAAAAPRRRDEHNEEIVRAHREGWSMRRIAREFGVSEWLVKERVCPR